MRSVRQTNPLKKRRTSLGFTQKDMSESLGITQSQYSKIENGETDPSKYLETISKILGCESNEVFSGEILREIETEFLNDPIKEMVCTYHQSKPNSVYLKMEGWFTKEEIERFVKFSLEGMSDEH